MHLHVQPEGCFERFKRNCLTGWNLSSPGVTGLSCCYAPPSMGVMRHMWQVSHCAGLGDLLSYLDASLKVTWTSQVHRPSVCFHFYDRVDFSNGALEREFSVPWETTVLFYDNRKYELGWCQPNTRHLPLISNYLQKSKENNVWTWCSPRQDTCMKPAWLNGRTENWLKSQIIRIPSLTPILISTKK